MRTARNRIRRRIELSGLIADRLAATYNRSTADAARLADACEVAGDRPGNLIGWIREYAALLEEPSEESSA